MIGGLLQDGPVMIVVDLMIILNVIASGSFLIKVMTCTRFEESTMGRLIVANQVAWLIVSVGGLLYRMHLPEPAGLVFLPIAIGVPAVTVWWHVALSHSMRTRDKLSMLMNEWHTAGTTAATAGRHDEALVTFRHAQQLARMIDAPRPR